MKVVDLRFLFIDLITIPISNGQDETLARIFQDVQNSLTMDELTNAQSAIANTSQASTAAVLSSRVMITSLSLLPFSYFVQ